MWWQASTRQDGPFSLWYTSFLFATELPVPDPEKHVGSYKPLCILPPTPHKSRDTWNCPAGPGSFYPVFLQVNSTSVVPWASLMRWSVWIKQRRSLVDSRVGEGGYAFCIYWGWNAGFLPIRLANPWCIGSSDICLDGIIPPSSVSGRSSEPISIKNDPTDLMSKKVTS